MWRKRNNLYFWLRIFSALFELHASPSAPVTVSDNWDEQRGVKSCKNQPKASISIMSGCLDLCMPASMVLIPCLLTMPQSSWSFILLRVHVHIRDRDGQKRLFCLCRWLRGHRWTLVGYWVGGWQLLRFYVKEVIWAWWGNYDTITEQDLVLWHGWWEKIVVRGPPCNVVERGSDVTSSILSALTLQRSQLGTGTLCSCRLPCSLRWVCYTSPQTSNKIRKKTFILSYTLQLSSFIISFLPKTC